MNRDESVKSRAHRTLKGVASYRPIEAFNEMPLELSNIQLLDGEKIIGIYENSPDNLHNNVIFTTYGIYIYAETWKFINYDEIERVISPSAQEKNIVDKLVLEGKSGGQFTIYFKGGKGKLRDVWEVLRFLNRVTKT